MYHEGWAILVGMLTGGATILIAVIAIITARSAKTQAESTKTQTDLMKEEFDTSHRPWIGPADEGIVNDKIRLGLKFLYRNFGSTPALNVIERWGLVNELPKRENIKET